MDKLNFNKLLLKTAFSCMACDGEIDKRELQLIKTIHHDHQLFGDIHITEELDILLKEINHDGQHFLNSYFQELKESHLSEEEEMKLVETAIEIIKADDKIEYKEIKFFKVIRSELAIATDKILEAHPDFEEYLEDDIISDSYMMRLKNDFFDTHNFDLKFSLEQFEDAIRKEQE